MKKIIILLLLFSYISSPAGNPDSTTLYSLYNPEQSTANPKVSKTDFKYMYMDAQDLFNYGFYGDALTLFKKLLATDLYNSNLNFYVGVCYLNLTKKRTDAITYLELAVKKTDPAYSYSFKESSAPVFAYLYLGQAYHLKYKFDDALKKFEEFKLYLTDKNKDGEFVEEVSRSIEIAKNALKITAKPIGINIDAFKATNGLFSDYGAVPSNDGTKIYFTSKRKGNLGGIKDNLNEYMDDIYYTQFKDNKWAKPKKIGAKINTANSDVMNCISADGKQLFFSRQIRESYDIFYSELSKKKKWQTPKKLGPNINTKDNEAFAYITSDGNTLLFSSDKPGGYGGYDIYMSEKLATGEWGKPFNLGSDVNSKYDEISPLLLADGTLYFSSNGHNTIGGFDIFYTTLSESGLWSKPENAGYPLNTVFDDTFFNVSQDGKKGFYSSAKAGGYGESDIYQISLP
jgi:hypothetical protein